METSSDGGEAVAGLSGRSKDWLRSLNCFPLPSTFCDAWLLLKLRPASATTPPAFGGNSFACISPGRRFLSLKKLPTFRTLLFSSEHGEQELALGGLKDLLAIHVTRAGSPSLVGGRVPPSDWQPRNRDEQAACLAATLELLHEMLTSGPKFAGEAWKYLSNNLRTLLWQRQLDELKKLVREFPIPDEFLGRWFEALDEFFQYECRQPRLPESKLESYCQICPGMA
jgi:hypothetical protein